MSISPESPVPPAATATGEATLTAARAALDYLRGKENPFASLARPQRMDDRFSDLHEPQLLADERNLLLQIIDSYRVEEYTGAADLPATRAVTIQGDRGSGKTHLLQSLAYRADGKSQILVRPSYFDRNLPFEEHLLSQFVGTLVAEDEVFRSRAIDDIAAAITRRVLTRAIRSLGPTDCLHVHACSRWQRFRLLLGGGEAQTRVMDRFAQALASSGSPAPDLHALLERHGFSPEKCCRLIHGHLRQFEGGPDLFAALRRDLYRAMASATLLTESEELYRLLEGQYPQAAESSSTRYEIVSRLLHVLTEACALVCQPVVVAFDNLERLISPQNAFDGELARAFWNALAQAVDNSKGLLILLFAESGLLEKLASFMDEFALHRLSQGVPVRGRGPIDRIPLNPPTPDKLKQLVRTRMKKLLAPLPEAGLLPETFPFDEKSLSNAITGVGSVRTALIRLRNAYSSAVYGKTQADAQTVPVVQWDTLLDSTWHNRLAAAPALDAPLAGYLPKIHAGLGALLQQCLPLSEDNRTLTALQATATIGNHPTYGIVSLLEFSMPGVDHGTLKLGVGFLLARGPGMPADLRAKFEFFRRPAKGDQLLILWPAPTSGDDLVELLPAGTRGVWDESRYRRKTVLRRIDLGQLRTLMVFPEWLSEVQAEQPVPHESMQGFVKEHFQSILHIVSPAEAQEERVLVDEN